MSLSKFVCAATRSHFLQVIGYSALGLSAFGSGQAFAAPASTQQKTGAEALDLLMQGNQRYAKDVAVNCNKNFDRRAEVAGGQHPFALILGCADSRVPPEVIFDQRLGDLFTVRIAGNIADANAIGSLEYAVLHFGSPLLVVLGHEKCGAVSATLEAVETHASAPGHIGSIVAAIKPAAESVMGKPGDTLENAIRANVKNVVAQLHASSSILAEHVASGKLQITGARYGLTDGLVTLVH